ncbi:hypothetical protein [Streptomyces sp. NBC_01497]|uniref:hypothetical protein n=1 Tax=Streptomyces sp. NBC_01497 TaxID=2903885 RepID=UPI002E3233FC|nr:hypothetical protein [Streptomyces sp. NBC_01497]
MVAWATTVTVVSSYSEYQDPEEGWQPSDSSTMFFPSRANTSWRVVQWSGWVAHTSKASRL